MMDDPEAVAIFGSVPAKRDVERCPIPIPTPAVEAVAWPVRTRARLSPP